MKVLLQLIATVCWAHLTNCQEYDGDGDNSEYEDSYDYSPTKGRDDCSNPELANYNFDVLPLQECGVGFLRNGDVADLDSFPWIAQFVYRNAYKKEVLFCGGALITRRFVLTSATCAVGYPATFKLIRARFSDVNSNTNPDCLSDNADICASFVDVPVQELLPHKEYNVMKKNHDIALVFLAKELPFTEFIRPICLPLENIHFTDQTLIVAGFGRPSPVPKKHLSVGHTKTVSRSECLSSLAGVFQFRDSSESVRNGSQFCAGPATQTCFADSGGPLMVNFESGCPLSEFRYVVVGIDSLCGANRVRPGLYTDVKSYVPWILDTISGRTSPSKLI